MKNLPLITFKKTLSATPNYSKEILKQFNCYIAAKNLRNSYKSYLAGYKRSRKLTKLNNLPGTLRKIAL